MDEHAKFFVENGYLVLPKLFASENIDTLQSEITKFARRKYRALNPPPKLSPEATDAEALNQILAIHFPHWASETIRGYIDHPSLA